MSPQNGEGQRKPVLTRRLSQPFRIGLEIYKWRRLIEDFLCKLKEFERITLLADKTDQSFETMICLTAAVINSR